MHSRKSLYFDQGTAWIKKNDDGLFDVTMGSYDGAEVCELVGLLILDQLGNQYGKKNVGLYRDDGLAAFEDISGPQGERIKKDITKFFTNLGLRITVKTNLKIVDFLDVILNLSNGRYSPFRKPNDHPLYINTKSNHPPTITKHLPAAISRRVSEISCNKEVFEKAKPDYQQALRASGYTEDLIYTVATENKNVNKKKNKKKNRKRKIIWFNPPYSKSVQTNIGKTFLRQLQKHFPKNHKFHKIFNKNTVKVSYSW